MISATMRRWRKCDRLGNIEGFETKKSLGFHSANPLTPEASIAGIAQKVKVALARRATSSPTLSQPDYPRRQLQALHAGRGSYLKIVQRVDSTPSATSVRTWSRFPTSWISSKATTWRWSRKRSHYVVPYGTPPIPDYFSTRSIPISALRLKAAVELEVFTGVGEDFIPGAGGARETSPRGMRICATTW
jgi:hypothetical protein